jgi:hypothetical protein
LLGTNSEQAIVAVDELPPMQPNQLKFKREKTEWMRVEIEAEQASLVNLGSYEFLIIIIKCVVSARKEVVSKYNSIVNNTSRLSKLTPCNPE